MERRALEKSVRNLENLYSVVVAVALTLSVEQLIVVEENHTRIELATLLMVVSLVATVVPFYHGAERHLEAQYVEAETDPSPGWLLWDFIVLFVEACVLIAAGALVSDPRGILVALILLWGIDVLWALVGRFVLGSADVIWRWGTINTVAAFVFGLILVFYETQEDNEVLTSAFVLATSLCRSAVDYWSGWQFYFPREEAQGVDA